MVGAINLEGDGPLGAPRAMTVAELPCTSDDRRNDESDEISSICDARLRL